MTQQKPKWEAEFDKKFVGVGLLGTKENPTGFHPYALIRDIPAEEIKEWIEKLIQSMRNDIFERVEKLPTKCKENHGCNDGICIRQTAKNEFKRQVLQAIKEGNA